MKRNWSKAWWMLFLVAGFAATVHSQDMTLQQALSEARANSFSTMAAAAGVEATQSAISVARAEYLPTLSANANFSRYDGDIFYGRFVPAQPGQPQDTEATETGPFDSTSSAFLQLTQTLYAGGAREAQVDARRVQSELAGKELEATRRQLDHDVTRAFFDVLLAERSVAVAEGSIERSEQNLTEVRRRLEEDEALRVDLLGAESRLAADEHELIRSRNQLVLARRAFNHHLAREQDAEVALSGDLSRPAFAVDRSSARQHALSNSTDVQKAELAVGLADAMLRGAKSNFKPKLEFQGAFTWLDNEMYFEGTYYGGALNFSIPFLKDARAGRGAAGEARARKALEESALAQVRSGVSLEIERSLQAVEEAEAAVELATKTLEYYQERYRVAQVAYREQLATFSDLLDDHAGLRQAELQVAAAQHQTRVAEAEVRRLTGQ